MATPPPTADFSNLTALFLNCTLKKSPRTSNTRGLMDRSAAIMRRAGVEVEIVRVVDHDVPPGVQPDMTEHGWEGDPWPGIQEKVLAADILVVGTPIWLGQISSVCRTVLERLYASSSRTNDRGQYIYYGRVGGCVVTGNEDGVKHCASEVLFALQHLGYTIPPQAETGWIGEAGPGPSYLDDESGGTENTFTQRTTTFMTWNLMHMARMLAEQGGLPTYGNQATAWEDGERYGHPDAT